MKAIPGRVYMFVMNDRARGTFTSNELPEWNENHFIGIDVTGNVPNIGDTWNGSTFSPYVPTPEEVAATNAADTATALYTKDLLAKQQAKADALITFLIDSTPAQVVTRVNSDITDLASARQVIAKLAVAISVLAKQGLR